MAGSVLKYATRNNRVQGILKRVATEARNEQIAKAIEGGDKYAVIALEFGVKETVVSWIAARYGVRRYATGRGGRGNKRV